MKKSRVASSMALTAFKVKGLGHELERLVSEVKRALDRENGGEIDKAHRLGLQQSVTMLGRAVNALENLVGGMAEVKLQTHLEVSPLFSQWGARIVLARSSKSGRKSPSLGAQALAVLLEKPAASVDAAMVAERIGCTVAVARTVLHRLVESGHAVRTGTGQFKGRES